MNKNLSSILENTNTDEFNKDINQNEEDNSREKRLINIIIS